MGVEVSGSVDEEEARFQRVGYIKAFRHPKVVRAIRYGYHGHIAVNYYK